MNCPAAVFCSASASPTRQSLAGMASRWTIRSAALEIICKIRCSIAPTYGAAREALSHALTYYALADYYRDLLARMGFAAEVEAMREAWKSGGFHSARKLITDRLFEGLPLIAGTSAEEVAEQTDPYKNAGATRIILPYVAASDDVVGEMKSFINYWNPATTGLRT